jgi:tetratricopeptide (TPR) repeat protein
MSTPCASHRNRRRLGTAATAIVALAIAASACSARRPVVATPERPAPASEAASASPGAASASLESFMATVRRLSTEARPERAPVKTLEGSDAALQAAIAASIAAPTPAAYRAVAVEYARWKVLDRAYGYLDRALRIDPRDPLTYEALARLWRDGGLPHVALGDAHRAVYYSNGSARSRNMLGTIFQAMGRHREARREYSRALTLEPDAAYAWSNLCYAWLLEGHSDEATAACETALRVDPNLSAAQNNLGLARAQAGDLAGAERAFALAGVRPRALFNVGIVQLADGQYAEAAKSFQRAYEEQPSWADAALRARQARGEARRRQE